MKANEINNTHGSKVRADSWAAKLTPDQQWQLYRRTKQSNDWIDAMDWAKEEFHLDKPPGRSAFYSWMAAMQKLVLPRMWLFGISHHTRFPTAMGFLPPPITPVGVMLVLLLFALRTPRPAPLLC